MTQRKFWPIYSEYDVELTKLNDQRVENIREYARTYNEMTDEKADELIRNRWRIKSSVRSFLQQPMIGSSRPWEQSRRRASLRSNISYY